MKAYESLNAMPRIAVGMITFNHAEFIENAIRGVLNQKTGFAFDLYIVDDASTDKTPEIIERTLANHSNRSVQVFYHRNEQNEGIYRSAYKVFQKIVDYDYFAICDGDDAWTFTGKLQAQVDFLEANPDYHGCCHDAEIRVHLPAPIAPEDRERILQQSKGFYKTYSQIYGVKPVIYPEDIVLRKVNVPTSSLVLRLRDKNILDEFVKFRKVNLSLKWIVELQTIKHGKFKYFNECWSVYNDHPGGVTKNRTYSDFNLQTIFKYKLLLQDDYYKQWHKQDIYQGIAREYEYLLINHYGGYGKFTRWQRWQFFLRYIWYSHLAIWHRFRRTWRYMEKKTDNKS